MLLKKPLSLLAIRLAPSSSIACKAAAATSTMATAVSPSPAAVEVSPSYKTLLSKLETITHLQRTNSVLSYDQMVFMPKEGAPERGAQMSALASVIHEKSTAAELKDLMEKANEELQNVDDKDALRLLELERKSFEENSRISPELAAKQASLQASAHAAWLECKANNDFASFAPVLKDCFDTCKEVADAKRGSEKDVSLYTQMLDQYEMGMPQQRIEDVFGEIQSALVPLIQNVLASESKPNVALLTGTFDVDAQQALYKDMVTQLGFNANQGRMDTAPHPFTSSLSSKDVRFTSRYSADAWYPGLGAMIHECGHAMYEQNLGPSPTSIDTALSLGTHESQSLFWERHIGLSKPFWKWATPQLQDKFGDAFASCTPDDLYAAVNAVSPSLIRVDADELTYPLHVILRYNVEKQVVGGHLAVEDIAQRWKEDMKSMLNVDVPDDAHGCLQDIHWSMLAVGYFPTYLIGAVTAAQLSHYCHQDLLDMDAMIAKGEFAPIKEWLTNKIHKHGKRYASLDLLLEDQLGEKLNPNYYIQYLTDKYTDLYTL